MKTQRGADIALGGVIALIRVFVLAASTWISVAGVYRLSPRTFPYVVGLLLLACGNGLTLRSWTLSAEGPAIAWPDAARGWTTNNRFEIVRLGAPGGLFSRSARCIERRRSALPRMMKSVMSRARVLTRG